MKNNITKWFKTGTAGITGIATMVGYRRTINNDKKVKSDRLLQETIQQHKSAKPVFCMIVTQTLLLYTA